MGCVYRHLTAIAIFVGNITLLPFNCFCTFIKKLTIFVQDNLSVLCPAPSICVSVPSQLAGVLSLWGQADWGHPCAPMSGVLALPGPLSFHINYRVLLPVENVALGAREIAPQEKHLAHRSKDRSSDPQYHSNVGKAWWPTRHLSAQEPGAGIPRASWLS